MRQCYICGRTDWIERHHVFGGALRKKSEKYGLVVDLCHWCHNEPPNGVHFNRENELKLKREFQAKFEREHPDLDFIKEFGRNYHA
nr:MAG TPA: Recombination enhancement, RecA-dependent nuclease [Caudoviricetes sp.]